MKKVTLAIIALVLVLGIGAGIVLTRNSGTGEPSTSTNTSLQSLSSSTGSDAQSTKTFTKSEVAQHAASDDCWTYIGDAVYNLTSYIPRHPGGNEILRACGADGTSLFEQRTTSDGQKVGSGTGHSSAARSQLESLKVGTLSD